MSRIRVLRPVARWMLASALMVAAWNAGPARASVVVPLSLPQLIEAADLIVDGEVIVVHSADDRGRVERVATVRVGDTWKGNAGEVVHVRLLGGDSGRTRVLVPGVPVIGSGNRLVWFLSRGADGTYVVVGLHQGAWRVTTSPLDGQALVASAASGRGAIARGNGARPPGPLAALKRDVLGLLEAGR